MIYLQNRRESQAVLVPKTMQIPDGELVMKARSTIDLETEINVRVLDLHISNNYMYLAMRVPEGCPNGEYQYQIQVDGEVVASGLMMLGDFSSPDQYEKPISYEQYNAN